MQITCLAPSRIALRTAKLPDRARAPDCDRVGRLDVALRRRLPTGREHVGQEQQFIVRQRAVIDLDMRRVRERHAQILRLSPGIAAGQLRIAEQARRLMPERLFLHLLVAVRRLADRVIAAPALLAIAAIDGEGDDHPVADVQRLVVLAHLDDLAHRLVAHDVARLHAWDEVVEQVEVRSADRAARHLDDGVAAVLDLRVRHAFEAYVFLAVPDERLHAFILPMVRAPSNLRQRRRLPAACLILISGRAS
jgi:hypothetical protein